MCCGIFGIASRSEVYRGSRVSEIVRRGLERLEYRGYDSVGVASIHNGTILVRKGKGKIAEVNRRLKLDGIPGRVVIGHTRWATHGAPSDVNAHPHLDCGKRVAVVHNGIVQNYLELRRGLAERGHVFKSETDTEVIAHLVEEELERGLEPFEAFKRAISALRGSYALGVLIRDAPDRIFFARKDSPLVIGLGEGVNFLASDIPAFLEYTRRVLVVYDGEVGYLTPDRVYVEDRSGAPVDVRSRVKTIDWTPDMARKEGYPHFMIKEIHEQPRALRDTLRGLGRAVDEVAELVLSAERVYVVAAGTSYHAGLVYEYLLNVLAGIPAVPLIASEYKKYRKSIGEGDVVIAISQSGETIDTLMAVREFKSRGARAVAVSNVVDSAIPRESDYVVYTRAGPEIGVAATKTFTTQLLVLSWLATRTAELVGEIEREEAESIKLELSRSPSYVSSVISRCEGYVKKMGEEIAKVEDAFYLGRGIGVPVAMEGALKLKEIAYIHAEAYPAGESKHGPIALVEPGFPVFFVVFEDEWKAHVLGNVEEMKARGALTIGLVPEGSREFAERLDRCLEMPKVPIAVAPIVYIVPLQLLAYYTAVERGYDPDKPRNLAKTVTVE